MTLHSKIIFYKMPLSLDLLDRCSGGGGKKLRFFGLATLKHPTQIHFIAFYSFFIDLIPIWFMYFVPRETKC